MRTEETVHFSSNLPNFPTSIYEVNPRGSNLTLSAFLLLISTFIDGFSCLNWLSIEESWEINISKVQCRRGNRKKLMSFES